MEIHNKGMGMSQKTDYETETGKGEEQHLGQEIYKERWKEKSRHKEM